MIRTKACVSLNGGPIEFAALQQIGRGDVLVALDDDAMERVRASRLVFETSIGAGMAIYGANTGVGAMKDLVLGVDDHGAFNDGLVRAHHFGIGKAYPAEVIRTAMAIRVNTALTGQVGCSEKFVAALVALLNADIVPYVRRTGSIGCADIGLMGQIGAVLTGTGEVYFGGVRVPTETAFSKSGLTAIRLAPKDGLSTISSNAISYSAAAYAMREAASALRVLLAVGMTSASAMGASIGPAYSAATIGTPTEAIVGTWLAEGARASGIISITPLHDPLSVRMMSQIFGAVIDIFTDAGNKIVCSTSRSDDNPIIIDGLVLTSGGSLPLAVSLALQSASVAIAHMARNSMNRCVLMSNGKSRGLPVNLRSNDVIVTGLGPLVKLVADIYSRILSLTAPVSAQPIVVADGMEDEAAFLPLIIERLESIIASIWQMAGLEAFFAAQAMDLKGDMPGGIAGMVHAEVRKSSAFYGDDRPLSAEIEAIIASISTPRFLEQLVEQAPLAGFDSLFALAPQTFALAPQT